MVKTSYKKKNNGLTVSDKIDTIVTNKYLALPIFALVMWLVYFVSVSTIGTIFTDWANDGVFGDGFYLLGIGRSAYEESVEEYGTAESVVNAFGEKLGLEAVELDEDSLKDILLSTVTMWPGPAFWRMRWQAISFRMKRRFLKKR